MDVSDLLGIRVRTMLASQNADTNNLIKEDKVMVGAQIVWIRQS